LSLLGELLFSPRDLLVLLLLLLLLVSFLNLFLALNAFKIRSEGDSDL